MKKTIFMMLVALASVFSMSAQSTQMNYAGSSNFGDNWSVTLQGGVVTPFTNFFSGHTAMTPVALFGVDKYVTPAVGFGAEVRTGIGTGTVGHAHNSHTAFDMVNVSGYAKFNLANMFVPTDHRHLFEPVVYTGLGWGHATAGYEDAGTHKHANYMTWRSGVELNFNLGKSRAWALVLNPSVVFGNPSTTEWATKLDKRNGYFECTAGVVYHFRTSNGTHGFTKAHLYDAAEVAALNARIAELEAREPMEVVKEVVVEKVVEVPAANAVVVPSTVYVTFKFNSAELTDEAKEVLDKVSGAVTVVAYASPEGSKTYNKKLSERRAYAVSDYLNARGVTVEDAVGMGVLGACGRIAVVTVLEN